MTIATFDLEHLSADITGHSGYGAPDIVCAGCSTLAFTLLQSCFTAGGEIDWRTDDGSFFMRISKTDNRERILAIFDTVIQGFKLLEAEYPGNVKVCFAIDTRERPQRREGETSDYMTRGKDRRRRPQNE